MHSSGKAQGISFNFKILKLWKSLLRKVIASPSLDHPENKSRISASQEGF